MKVELRTGETFIFPDPGDRYTVEEFAELFCKAGSLGFSLEKGSCLEDMTVHDLEILVTRRQ